jgi:hypothetical protein
MAARLYLHIITYSLLFHSITNHYTREFVTERGLQLPLQNPFQITTHLHCRYRLLATICQTATNCSKFSERKGLTIRTHFRRTQLHEKDDNWKAGFSITFQFQGNNRSTTIFKTSSNRYLYCSRYFSPYFLKIPFNIIDTPVTSSTMQSTCYTDIFQYIYCCLIFIIRIYN